MRYRGESARGEVFCAWYDPSYWLSGSIAFYRVRAWIGRGAGREHVPSRYFIYGHEEVLENRFQSNWNGTRVEPVRLDMNEGLFRAVPLSRLFIGCNTLTFFALTRAVPFRHHARHRPEIRKCLTPFDAPIFHRFGIRDAWKWNLKFTIIFPIILP